MEFEDVSEEVEWQAKRVAAAFGLQEYEKRREEDWLCAYVGWMNQTQIWWNIDARTQEFFYIEVGEGGCEVNCSPNWSKPDAPEEWSFYPNSKFHELMAHGLYRLGFEDEAVLSQLPTLSAHEKMELRLSMPREFWPKTWLDEEEGGRANPNTQKSVS